MSQTNQNFPQDPNQRDSGKKSMPIFYWVIIAVLLAGCVYLFMSQKSTQDKLAAQIKNEQAKTDSVEKERKALDDDFKAASVKIEELMTKNSKADSSLQQSKKEMAEMQTKIRTVIQKKDVSIAELKHAKEMIKDLTDKVKAYEERIAILEKENQHLKGENSDLNNKLDTAKENIKTITKLGSILHTSNIRLVPEHIKKDGTDKVTKKARKTDVLRITFDIDENHIAQSGTKQIYLRILGPDNTILSDSANGSGKFTSSHNEPISFSVLKEIPLIKDQPVKDVVVDWKQNGHYQKGDYNIEFYSEGVQVGKGTVKLK